MEIEFKEYMYENFYILGHTRQRIKVAVSDNMNEDDIRQKIEDEYDPDFEFSLESHGDYNDQNTRWNLELESE